MNIWEQRENLSFTIDKPASPLVNEIVKSIVKNKKFSWVSDQLSIEDEALVQRLLRERRIELRCYKLDQFPTSTDEFIPLIIRIPFNLKALLTRKHQLIKSVVTSDDYNIILMILVAIAGICWYGLDLLGWALLYSWFICNLMFVVMHEYWAHGYIEPKNKFIGYVLDLYMSFILLYYCFSRSTPRRVAYMHKYHHRFFQTKSDSVQYNIDHNHWFRYLLKFKMNTDPDVDRRIYLESEKDFVDEYARLDDVEKFCDRNANKILPGIHLLIALLFGIHVYIYFVLLPVLFNKLFYIYYSEVVAHKINRDGNDMPWTFPLMLNTAYHNSHHLNVDKLVLGPGRLKYINPQYYFIRVFYKIKSEML